MTHFDNFRRFFKGILCADMDEEGAELEMLDQLASNCAKLRQELLENPGEEEKLLENYIKEADSSFTGIEDFPEGLDWFNTSEPLSLSGNLSGKIVILDFFTYCCINCMHILPDLRRLEELYSIEDGLVVVGVHSAKFENEKDSANILSAAQRYDIRHPIMNDSKFVLWKRLKVHCWPTLLVLGPKGNPLFILMGEGHSDTLNRFIKASLKFYKPEIKSHKLPMRLALEKIAGKNMKFPGKIASSGEGEDEKYAVSDSGNHRIIYFNSKGEILATIGGKERGFKDGSFENCRFDSPQGICFYKDNIFVADTENHAIRKINLESKTVETMVGTGKQGNDYKGGQKEQSISSPWDVSVYRFQESGIDKEMLIIAMAGTHQIWAYFLDEFSWWRSQKCEKGRCAAIAGNGHEQNRNNSYPNNASFAQPSGLALNTGTKELFIADSESSAIRKISLIDGKVQGVVGGDRNPLNLFAFGDVDGKQFSAKLQHPLGVCYNQKDQMVYVADSYNHKIKRINPNDSTIESLNILDEKGEKFLFNEPGGLCVDSTGEYLIITNTNNHTIDKVCLSTLKREQFNISFPTNDQDDILSTKPIPIEIGKTTKISIKTQIEEPAHFTDGAPQKWVIEPPIDWTVSNKNGSLDNGGFNFEFTPQYLYEGTSLQIKCRLSLCADEKCFPKVFTIKCPFIEDSNQDSSNHNILLTVGENNVSVL